MRTIILKVSFALAFIIIIVLGYPTTCLTMSSKQENIIIGVLSSLLLIILIEGIGLIRDLLNYSYLKGTFKRIEIHSRIEQRKDDKIYENITSRYIDKKINIEINIKSIGEGRFKGTTDYEEGNVEFDIFLDKVNPSYGVGTYQYISKKPEFGLPDLGKYELIRDKINSKRIYIYYTNIVQSGLAEGYEIWEKS